MKSIKSIKDYIKLESASGLLLMLAAILAILCKNTGLVNVYDSALTFNILRQPLIFWVNDLFMVLFFLLVGLELKREVLEGRLASRETRSLPILAAFGGVFAPALIYVYFNKHDPVGLQGWAIPVATDIAFAISVLYLVGNKVPTALKLSLLTLAIVDDLIAVLIIAFFYTAEISYFWLFVSSIPIILLFILNKFNIKHLSYFLIIGVVLWFSILKSGMHPTIAGILLALFIPLSSQTDTSPLKNLEHKLHPWVSFAILPLFAFFNAGVNLHQLSFANILHPITLGITLGLFIGKQVGVMFISWCSIKFKICKLPEDVSWLQYYGMAILTGIGFTMSLFIGSISLFDVNSQEAMRLGIILGSLLSGIIGYSVLRISLGQTTH